jgi:hypothetical protein
MAWLLARIGQRQAALIASALLAVAIAGSLAYWPGLMIWDSARQYDQALSGEFDDWHPTAMEWIWRLWTGVARGPAPMLLMQLALYAAGYALLIRSALRRDRRVRAVAVAACALLPLSIALMADVIKDSLMTAVVLLAVGLWVDAPEGARWRRVGAAVLVVAAATLRFNAFLAGAPLLVALAPQAWRDRPLKIAGLALAAGGLLLLTTPLANRALGAQKSGVEYSLTIYDLGGIGYYSGKDVFPPLGLTDPVAANRACYTTRRWDSYAEWAPEPCDIDFDLVRDAFERRHISQRLWWLNAILTHPVAYVQHRLGHWNVNAAFLVHHETGRPVPVHSDPNDAHSQVPDTAAVRWIDRLARWSAHTPLGWPACWMALAFGLAALSPILPSGRWVQPLALSGLLYGLGYGVVSVATDTRYYFWTMTATALALVLALTDGADWRAADRRRLAVAGGPLAVVVVLSVAWRLL